MKLKLYAILMTYCFINATAAQMENVKSRLEIFNIETNERRLVLEEDTHFEAPNWSRDGKYLLLNSKGLLYTVDLTNPKREHLDTDFAQRCNNDHGISPDGSQIVISHHDHEGLPEDMHNYRSSRIYILPIEGGEPQMITPKTPSFWHGWSPDGKELAYVGERDGEFDIYTIDVDGGEERKITNTPGLDDGPDYSPDGQYIYYNSMASGKMEIWRMAPDGSKKEQLTDDAYSNWFPHPSPDGKGFIYIAYIQDQGSKHPAMKDVVLRYYDLKSSKIKDLCFFTGGQGTINVPSWSPDGKEFAFVTYEYLK